MIEVKREQWENALLPIEVTVDGILQILSDLAGGYAIRVVKSLENSTPFYEQKWQLFSSTSMNNKPEQPENARSPIEVREAERVIEVKAEKFKSNSNNEEL